MFKASVGASSQTDPRKAVAEVVGKMRQAVRGSRKLGGGSSPSQAVRIPTRTCSVSLLPSSRRSRHSNTSHTGVITSDGFVGGAGFLGAMSHPRP